MFTSYLSPAIIDNNCILYRAAIVWECYERCNYGNVSHEDIRGIAFMYRSGNLIFAIELGEW